MRQRVAVVLAFIGLSLILLFTLPVAAAPAAQSTLPEFILNAETVISVTVAITDGQVILVPINLTFITQNEDGETDVTLIADVDQQPGLFIGVAPSRSITATIELPGSATPTPSASSNAGDGEGTHVANRNSNRRAGPGTNFAIVGRVPAGGAVTVVGQNNDGTWLELDDGSWVAEFLLDPIPNRSGNTNNGNNQDNDADNNDNGDDTANDEDDDNEEAEPAETPGPTPTTEGDDAQADNQGAIETYVIEVISIGGSADSAMNALNGLIANPDPASTQWRNDVRSQLASLSNALDQYLALTPVPGYEALHDQVTEMALTCEQAVDYLVGGLQNPLSIDPGVATQSVQACSSQANALASTILTIQ